MAGPDVISVCVYRTREGALEVALRYAYKGKPLPSKERTRLAKVLLGEALTRLREGKPADLGFAEDAVRRVRTDRVQA